jgi:CheY-like chemotaxis protein
MDERNTGGRTVLVAEDDDDTRRLIRKLCEGEGARVVEARDGREAVAAFGREIPSLVVMDLSMPKMDGIDAAREIRSHEAFRGVPILFVTAHGDMGMDLFARAADMPGVPVEYLPKPFDNVRLIETIRGLLARAAEG